MREQIPEVINYGLYVKPGERDLDDVQEKDKKPPKESIEECRKWIRKWIDKRKSINKNRWSYSLKQLVEDYRIEDTYEGHIGNGAFIQAALDEGYQIKPFGPNSPNAYFNMSFVRIDREVKRRKEERYNKSREVQRNRAMMP